MAFEIRRGTNISHWLSQSPRRGADRLTWFTSDDVKRLADWGFDHLRLPVDEEQLWNISLQRENEAFDLLQAGLDWCQSAGLRAIVDLHILRSHYFNQDTTPLLFIDALASQRFADCWADLSAALSKRPLDQVAYELMNEPVATDDQDWNRVARGAYTAIRTSERERIIVLGSNRFNSASRFDVLEVPADPHMMLTFHYYNPMLVTHYNAPWWREGGDYSGPVQYPGEQISANDLAALPEEKRQRLQKWNRPFDRQAILADLAQPLAKRQRTGLPLFCGEFGVINRAPLPIRQAWYRDVISVFTVLKIAWACWDYKGSFGLVDAGGKSTGIAEVMLAASHAGRS